MFQGLTAQRLLALYRAADFAHAMRIVESIYAYQGAGHSVGLHSARPEHALALGLALRGVATAAIDVSDGLIGDLGHILERSADGAMLALGGSVVPREELRQATCWQAKGTGFRGPRSAGRGWSAR